MNSATIAHIRLSQCFSPPWRDRSVLETIDVSGHPKCKRTYRIAVLYPNMCSIVDYVYKGFVETLDQQSPLSFEFSCFNAKKNPARMKELVEHVLLNEYDLIMTMGMSCSLLAKHVMQKKRRLVPIVFCGVVDPVGNKLVESMTSSGCHVTGVAGGASNKGAQASLLLALKKGMRKVVVLYDPMQRCGQFERRREEIEAVMSSAGVNVVARQVFHTDHVLKVVTPDLHDADALMIMRDHTVLPRVDDLIKACNHYGITLMTSDWYSVNKGAALGFAASDYVSGAAAADKVRLLLEGDFMPTNIPVTIPEYIYKLKINRSTMQKQNLIIDPQTLSYLQATHIV